MEDQTEYHYHDVYIGEDPNVTMIYTAQQSKTLADQAVERIIVENQQAGKEPISEVEKARLWHLVRSACEGT